jgi:hypothetical protein
MKLYSADDSELMTISRLERDGNQLLIKGKVFGTMPMMARLTPQELRAGLKLLGIRDLLFVLTMPFRKATPVKGRRSA